MLERHDLARKEQSLRGGTIIDATIIAAPSSTKNKDGERDPDMHQTQERQPVLLRDVKCTFWLRQGALSRFGEEHRTGADV
ncbi:transposase [Xanthomonas oryzae pv. oryzicola BLS256]|uniref:Transposase n=1 Tax=Xanthomonas oryzae pv. oryzicola (strain BLS256) TaxID=383407 RepID=G7TL68_XANOB|nr:transposase [Xanthomonas oryzae pv. oryzicola BLS256]